MARRVVCFPGDDVEFERVAGEIADSVAVEEDDDRARGEAEALLRRRYPAAALHRKEPLAEFDDFDSVTWYAYRDGGLIATPAGSESPASGG